MPSASRLVASAIGGVLGGVAMSVLATQIAPRVLPDKARPKTVAPVKAVRWAEEQAGERGALSGRAEKAAAGVAHLAYSAAAGASFGLARQHVPPLRALPAPAAGAAFGLAVWAVSFEGLLPALGVMQPTTDHPPVRWPMPLMGHAVFGIVTALVTEQLAE